MFHFDLEDMYICYMTMYEDVIHTYVHQYVGLRGTICTYLPVLHANDDMHMYMHTIYQTGVG